MSSFDIAVKRVVALNFKVPLRNYDLAYDLLLVKEYLRRILLWSQVLNSQSWLFLDVTSMIKPSVVLAQDVIDKVDQIYAAPPFIRPVCKMYLRWSLIEDDQKSLSYHLPPPYEPLLHLFEGGGFFSRENNILLVWDSKGLSQGIPIAPNLYDRSESFISEDVV